MRAYRLLAALMVMALELVFDLPLALRTIVARPLRLAWLLRYLLACRDKETLTRTVLFAGAWKVADPTLKV